jgi:hypothetical protein
MRPYLCLVAFLVAGPSWARADGPWPLFDGCHWSMPSLSESWRQRRCWCPDDYCRKTLSCVPPNAKGCVDDYCRKALPCVPPNARGCVDDYCTKTCLLFLGKLCEPWYTCGRSQPGEEGTCRTCPSKP